MSDREHPDRPATALPGHAIENPVLDNPLPELEAMLRDAAAGARRRAFVPSYETVEGVARGRRTARVAASSLFAVVLGLSIGGAVIAGVGRGGDDRNPDRPAPAASAVALDPSLRQYQTTIPVLAWTPDVDGSQEAVSGREEFLTAVFSALGAGDHDYGHIKDLKQVFTDAPVGGPAIIINQSTTKAALERAAANVRKLDGVRDATVVEVTGLWFTVSASGPASAPNDKPDPAGLNPTELNLTGGAGGGKRDATGQWINWISATYIGPPITRAHFDLIRQRAAKEVHVDISKVVITAESATSTPAPTKS